MKLILPFLFFTYTIQAQNKVEFDQYFFDQTLRIDYYHTGNAREEFIAVDKIYKYNKWAGNPNQCIQKSQLGEFLPFSKSFLLKLNIYRSL